jgi:hypothetical protein
VRKKGGARGRRAGGAMSAMPRPFLGVGEHAVVGDRRSGNGRPASRSGPGGRPVRRPDRAGPGSDDGDQTCAVRVQIGPISSPASKVRRVSVPRERSSTQMSWLAPSIVTARRSPSGESAGLRYARRVSVIGRALPRRSTHRSDRATPPAPPGT